MKRTGAIIFSVLMVITLSLALLPLTVYAAPSLSSIAHYNVTEDGAVVIWSTNIAATGNVNYGTTPGGPYPNSAPAPADITADSTLHAVVLDGLSANTTYYYIVKSSDGEETISAEFSFTTLAFAISGVNHSSITSTSATITWNTSVPATGNVEYGLSESYGSNASDPSTADSQGHIVVLSGLSPDTTYHYRVISEDSSGNEITSPDSTFKTSVELPPLISNIAPSIITITTINKAIVTWDTDEPATSQVEYGTTSAVHGGYASTTTIDSALIASHSITLEGLSPNTIYYYRVISMDAYDKEAVSGEQSFVTANDTTQPVISGITESDITTTTAIIRWDTDEPATSQVEWGETTSYGSSSPADSTADNASHLVVLSGLTSETLYHYRVKSADASGNMAISADGTFTTSSDSSAPVISGVTATDIIATAASILWNTDEPATSQVEYGLTETYGSITTLDSTLVLNHSVFLSELASGTTYHYRVKSIDNSGNQRISPDSTLTTADITPPTVPANIAKATPTGDNTPTFTWDAATDAASGVASYEVKIDTGIFTDIGNVTTFTVADANALSDGSHTFEVKAVDNAGNKGDAGSLPFNIDATPPTVAANIIKTTPDRTNIPVFTWDASTDAASGLERYQVSIDSGDFVDIGSSATFAIADTSALTDGSHTLRIRAEDRAGNISEIASLAFTIDTTPPTTPANIARSTPDGDNSPTFTWDAATDATSGVASYQVRVDSDDFVDIGNVTTFTVADADLLSDGSHTFEVRTVDEAGNMGDAGSITFEVSGGGSGLLIILLSVIGGIAVVALAVYFLKIRRARIVS